VNAIPETKALTRPRLARVTLRGFKTIRELKDFELGPISVLIGPNGAGKTNFLSFFNLLSWAMMTPENLKDGLQDYVNRRGGASMLLHDGPKLTPQIESKLWLQSDDVTFWEYRFFLSYAAGDTLVIADEDFHAIHDSGMGYVPLLLPQMNRPAPDLGSGRKESVLVGLAESGIEAAKFILGTLRRMIVYQFHDTSPTSRIRNKWDVEDARWLKEDGANLAPFLYRLKNNEPSYYQRIVESLRAILPFFADFEFEPEFGKLLLKWRERGTDRIFNSSQAADGMLRVMALLALLQQPEKDLPDVLFLDEPELGLHPYAIEVLAGLLQSVSKYVQVVVATQSVSLLDRFEPPDVVVTERSGRESTFRRLSAAELSEWREQYTLSELWEKNVLGGRPKR
jgi:predicted ATPase